MRKGFEDKQKLITGVYLFLGVWLLLGGAMTMLESRQIQKVSATKRLERVMKNTQTTKILEDNLKIIDQAAMTDQGVIRRSEINPGSAKLSDNGEQVSYTATINNDPDLVVTQTIDIGPEGNVLGGRAFSVSDQLTEKLRDHAKQTHQPEPAVLPEVTETPGNTAPHDK